MKQKRMRRLMQCAPPHKHGYIVTHCFSSRRAAERVDAIVAHGVAFAAACQAAHEPLQRLFALRASVADAANEDGRVAAGAWNECVAFGALRRVVNILGAYVAVLVQPFRGQVDGG